MRLFLAHLLLAYVVAKHGERSPQQRPTFRRTTPRKRPRPSPPKQPKSTLVLGGSNGVPDATCKVVVGRAELLRVFTTKTQFWYLYEEFAREEDYQGVRKNRIFSMLLSPTGTIASSRARLLRLRRGCSRAAIFNYKFINLLIPSPWAEF